MIEDLKNWQQLTLFQCQQWHTANGQQVTMVTGPVNIPAQIMSSHSMEHSSWSPCVVPIHRASVIHFVCVCPRTKEERCVCVCEKSVNSVWITSQVVFHCVNQGYILGQWPIFYYDFCLYTCAVWYIGCVWSCDVYIVRDQNPTVTIPHYCAVKHGHHWSNQITNKYQRLVEPLSRILLELIIETRVAYPSPTNKSSSIILHHTC